MNYFGSIRLSDATHQIQSHPPIWLGNYVGHVTSTDWTNFQSCNPSRLYIKMGTVALEAMFKTESMRDPRQNPVGIWCQNDVVSTSMRRDDVASTLIRRQSRRIDVDTTSFWHQMPTGKSKNDYDHLHSETFAYPFRLLWIPVFIFYNFLELLCSGIFLYKAKAIGKTTSVPAVCNYRYASLSHLGNIIMNIETTITTTANLSLQ